MTLKHIAIREIRQYELIPRGYGVAWLQWHRDVAVCMPIPFNVLAAWVRAAWLFLIRYGATDAERDRVFEEGRRAGLSDMDRRVEIVRAHEWEAFSELVIGTGAADAVKARIAEIRARIEQGPT